MQGVSEQKVTVWVNVSHVPQTRGGDNSETKIFARIYVTAVYQSTLVPLVLPDLSKTHMYGAFEGYSKLGENAFFRNAIFFLFHIRLSF